MNNIIGVSNPYGLVQQAGRKRSYRKKTMRRKGRRALRKTRKNNK